MLILAITSNTLDFIFQMVQIPLINDIWGGCLKKYIYLIFFILFLSMLEIGCTGSNSNKIASQASLPQHTETAYQDLEWANSVTQNILIFNNDTAKITSATNNNDFYTASNGFDIYKQDL